MVCPKCEQGKAYIKITRKATVADNPATIRRYECSLCGARFTTYELDADTIRSMSRSYSVLQSFHTSTVSLIELLTQAISKQSMADLKELLNYLQP